MDPDHNLPSKRRISGGRQELLGNARAVFPFFFRNVDSYRAMDPDHNLPSKLRISGGRQELLGYARAVRVFPF
eukprot:2865723-Rhodomonas_salina.1